ncbi:hypothetical protein COCON_G00045600 [Conger conger]|uniref:TGF-beta family profile domain-containing protein n=2 Tax=Conger conger TaxID=82655 RepID=A0A9Q1DUM3_CONCO|nr:bone morphogenetic protein 15 isoform X1 [Conger conger]KAJ8282041.1 hypothetical protein COCON_G00045600 [Conger conger]
MLYVLYHGLQNLDSGSLPGCYNSHQRLDMKATYNHSLCKILIFSCLFSMSLTLTPPQDDGEMASSSSFYGDVSTIQSRQKDNSRQQKLHHRSPTKDQVADQNLRYMLNLYNRAADTDGQPREPRILGFNTVRLIRSTSTRKRFSASSPDQQYSYMVQYELKALPLEKLVRAAFVHLRSTALSRVPLSCGVNVSSLGPAGQRVSSGGQMALRPHDQWTEMDITPLISSQSEGRLSLAVQYQCVEDRLVKITMLRRRGGRRTHGKPVSSQTQLRAPALLLFLAEEAGDPRVWAGPLEARAPSVPRPRRSKEPGSIGADIPNYIRENGVAKNQCKLHPYRVTFQDLGWDHWIIAPHKYNPRYCRGDCPRILHYGYNSPNHAIVQNFIHEMGVGEVPPPACVPYKYKPISVLMMEKNGSIVYKEYEDMIAESCTCR